MIPDYSWKKPIEQVSEPDVEQDKPIRDRRCDIALSKLGAARQEIRALLQANRDIPSEQRAYLRNCIEDLREMAEEIKTIKFAGERSGA